MGKRLFEIEQEWNEIFEMLADDETDEQMIFDTLESIEGEFEDKADNYAKIIKELESKRDARKLEAKRLTDSAKVFDNRINALKQNLFNGMKLIAKPKVITNLFTFTIAKNGGKQALTIDGDVPKEYTKTIIENDTDKIRQALENGKELPFAHLEPRGESLRIK